MGDSTVWKILKCRSINKGCILIQSTDPVVSPKASMALEGVRRNAVRMIKCSKKKITQKKQKGDGLEGFYTRSIPILVHYWQTVES